MGTSCWCRRAAGAVTTEAKVVDRPGALAMALEAGPQHRSEQKLVSAFGGRHVQMLGLVFQITFAIATSERR